MKFNLQINFHMNIMLVFCLVMNSKFLMCSVPRFSKIQKKDPNITKEIIFHIIFGGFSFHSMLTNTSIEKIIGFNKKVP